MASRASKIVRYGWVAVAIAMLYLVWVFAARRTANREMERASEAKRTKAYPPRNDTAETGLKILQFYASPGELARGEHALVCYGVQSARAVRIEPPVEELKPAFNRCFEIKPVRTTTYTLVAEGLNGTTASASFTVKVTGKRAAQPQN